MKFFAFVAVVGLSWLMTGCVGTVDGRSRMGMPFSKDQVVGRYERSVQQVFDAAKAALAFNGPLTAENTINHSLEAKVDQRTVYVRVDEVDPAKPVSAVTVQVRTKGGFADVDLAHEIEKQIALKLVR